VRERERERERERDVTCSPARTHVNDLMIPGRTKRDQVAPNPPSLISCTAKHQNALMVWRSLPTQPHTVTISKHSLWGYRRYGFSLLLGSWTFTQCWSKWNSLDHAWKGDYKGSSASMVVSQNVVLEPLSNLEIFRETYTGTDASAVKWRRRITYARF
jgi:hypothetical protein